jgi:hypothetical protein
LLLDAVWTLAVAVFSARFSLFGQILRILEKSAGTT